MTETAASPKQQLADLIDAFASAKMTGNETLVRLSLTPLQQFINTYDFVPAPPAAADEDEATEE